MSARVDKVRPTQIPLATTPFFEHLEQEFGRQVLSAQTCASYEAASASERWYCVRTHHNMEYVALVSIASLGFPAHVALFVERTKRNPPRPGGIKMGTPVLRRCFPGYVFVALDLAGERWPAVKHARGFGELLKRANGEPVPVPHLAMFKLMEHSRVQTEKLEHARNRRQQEIKASEAAEVAAKRQVFVSLADMSEEQRIALLHKVIYQRIAASGVQDAA